MSWRPQFGLNNYLERFWCGGWGRKVDLGSNLGLFGLKSGCEKVNLAPRSPRVVPRPPNFFRLSRNMILSKFAVPLWGPERDLGGDMAKKPLFGVYTLPKIAYFWTVFHGHTYPKPVIWVSVSPRIFPTPWVTFWVQKMWVCG